MKEISLTRIVVIFLLCLTVSLTHSNCCYIINGSEQRVRVEAPKGAKIYVDDILVGTAPATLALKRGQKPNIIVDSPKHATFETTLDRKIDPWFWANFFTYGVGFLVDYFEGTAYTYESVTP